MKLKVYLDIGYAGEIREDCIEIDDNEIEDMTEVEKREYFDELTDDWANDYISTWWKISD